MGQADRSRRAAWVQSLWHLSDLLAIAVGFSLGYWIRFFSPLTVWLPAERGIPPVSLYLLGAAVTAAVWIPLHHFFGLYRLERGRPRHRAGEILRAQGFGVLSVAALSFFYRDATFSRVAMPLIWILTAAATIAGRRAAQWCLRRLRILSPLRFAVIGSGPAAERLARALPRSPYPHACVGWFRADAEGDGGGNPRAGTAGPEAESTAASVPAAREIARAEPARDLGPTNAAREVGSAAPAQDLGPVETLAARGASLDLDLLVLASPSRSAALLPELFALCQRHDWDLLFLPELFSVWGRRTSVEEIDGLPVLRLRGPALSGWGRVLKRTCDLAGSIVLLVLLAPLLAAIALAVRWSSPGPIFHRQERVGRDRRVFRIVKFRSMRVDAEAESGPVWAERGDPRRTRLGAFLRRWSLDELPQLWNVLRGEMSLVGPRPERPYFVSRFEAGVADYYDRHRVKSGITGWAQVHGLRGDTPIELRTDYDLYYVENWSIWLDLRILVLTVLAVFRHPGE